MITRPHLDDPEMAIRYLSDQLPSSEREAFEEHYLAHPKAVAEMELDAKLKAGLICIRDSGELDHLAVSKRLWFVTPIAIAASVLVAIITLLVSRYVVPEAILASSTAALRRPLGSQLAVAATYQLVPTRTGLYDAVIPLPKSPRAIRLQMVLDIEPPIPPLEVTLVAIAADNASRTELAALHQLHADQNGIITLYLNSTAVRPGTYELSVSGEAKLTETPDSTFILKVTSSEGSLPARSP
jgi:hypothetical protein